ncbi:MAG: CHAT domain-containing protein [Bacteroidota bacterium]|nr:CHAT domain-containing protein [Bacteroidota bacterium]
MKKCVYVLLFFTIFLAKETKSQSIYKDSVAILEHRLKKMEVNSSPAAVIRNKISELAILLEQTELAKKSLKVNLLLIDKKMLTEDIAVVTYDLLGELAYLRKDLEEAEENYLKSLEIRKKIYGEQDCRTALAYSRIAKYYNYRIVKDSALIYSKKSVDILYKNPETADFVPAELILCENAYATKIYHIYNRTTIYPGLDTARLIYNQALNIAIKKYSKESYQVGLILHQIANTYTDIVDYESRTLRKDCSKNFVKALQLYHQSYNIFQETIGEYNLKVSNSFYARGILYEYAFEKDSLIVVQEYLNQAIETLKPNFNIRQLKEVPETISSLNQYQLILLLNRKIYINQFYSVKLNKVELQEQKLISELTIKLWDLILGDFESENVNQILALYLNIPFEHAVAFQLEEGTKESLNKAFQYADKAKYSTLLKTILKINPNYSFRLPNLKVEKLQNSLDKNVALIEFFCNQNEIYAFVISKEIFEIVRLPGPNNLNNLIVSLRKSLTINNISDFSSDSYELFQKIFVPIQEKIPANITNLKIVPDGILSYIPFDALISKPNPKYNKDFRKLDYLIKKYKISYAFSASLLLMEKSEHNPDIDFVAITPSYKDKNELFFASRLGENLKQAYVGNFYSGIEAKSQILKSKKLNCKVLHLASHAIFDEKNHSNSGFFFSDAKGEDKLTLSDISKYSINAQLGVLMGCETGIGIIESGEGIVGLPRTMRMAGVRNIVSTLWQVDDEYSSHLIEAFYFKLADGIIPEDALHQIKLEFINSAPSSALANPFYWAGIIYTGDSSSVSISRNDYSISFWLIGGVIIFFGVLVFNKRKAKAA